MSGDIQARARKSSCMWYQLYPLSSTKFSLISQGCQYCNERMRQMHGMRVTTIMMQLRGGARGSYFFVERDARRAVLWDEDREQARHGHFKQLRQKRAPHFESLDKVVVVAA